MIEGHYKSKSTGIIYYFKQEHYYDGEFYMTSRQGRYTPASPKIPNATGYEAVRFEYVLADQTEFFNSL